MHSVIWVISRVCKSKLKPQFSQWLNEARGMWKRCYIYPLLIFTMLTSSWSCLTLAHVCLYDILFGFFMLAFFLHNFWMPGHIFQSSLPQPPPPPPLDLGEHSACLPSLFIKQYLPEFIGLAWVNTVLQWKGLWALMRRLCFPRHRGCPVLWDGASSLHLPQPVHWG